MIEVYKTSMGWQFRIKALGQTVMESVHYYETRLQAARAVAIMLREKQHKPRVLFLDENHRSITVDLSGEGNPL